MKKVLSLILAVIMGLTLCACGKDSISTTPSDTPMQQPETMVDYSITVKNKANYPLKNVKFSIVSANGQIAYEGITSESGYATVPLDKNSEFFIRLTEVPAGYLTEDKYSFTAQNCDIVLSSQVITEDIPKKPRYELGDVVYDFTVITTEGEKFTLSEVLKEKKAVMLEFFYLSMSDVALQNLQLINAAYSAYKNDIAVLAIEIADGEDVAIACKNEYGLTFDVTHHQDLFSVFGGAGCPYEIIIDRNGVLCMQSLGGRRSEDAFKNAFKYFTAENYIQHHFNDLEEIPQGFTPEECPGHSIVSREIITEATCTTAGIHKGFCKYCAIEMEEEYFAEHNYSFGICIDCGKKQGE